MPIVTRVTPSIFRGLKSFTMKFVLKRIGKFYLKSEKYQQNNISHV